ncbi:MAG: 50S ribosomal protein L23, partial [Patescibacteria group bacterium]
MIVLIRPIITEKALRLATNRQYTFEVDRRANAIQIGKAVAAEYNVTVSSVRTSNIAGVVRRFRKGQGHTRSWKKAVVTITKGGKIPGFEIEVESKD